MRWADICLSLEEEGKEMRGRGLEEGAGEAG